MKAEIIAIGSELLTPDHIDTNSLYLTEKLWQSGFYVHLKTIVGDSEDGIAQLVETAIARSSLVVITGGLGPTEDDLTRKAVARALRRDLAIDPSIVEALQRRFASRGYNMAKINERQAEVIAGAEVLANPVGTAPGMWIEHQGIGIALLPGPPREVQPMFETQVLPRISSLASSRRVQSRSFIITGLTESEVDSRVAPAYTSYPAIQTTILSSPGGITLKLYQWLDQGQEPRELDELASKIHEILGDAVFSTLGEPLEEVVGRQLREAQATLSVAESCTSGLIGWRITRIPGSSDYFRGGVLCYSNEAKVKLCGVPEEILKKNGAVSAEVAEALASGIRRQMGSSIGLSVTGIAGPGGGSEEKPVGLAYIGLSDRTRILHMRRIFPGDRDMIRERAAYYALSCLRGFMMHSDPFMEKP